MGAIGSAVVRGLLEGGRESEIIAVDMQVEKLSELAKLGVSTTQDNRWAAEEAEIIILCVKPKDVGKVLEGTKEGLAGKLVISVAAAVSLEFLKKVAPKAKFIRTMPNLGVLVREAFIAYCADSDVTREDKKQAESLLESLGKVAEINERQMDAITALSGCAPGYLALVLEAMTNAGQAAGLPADLALAASAQSLVGTGKLVLDARKTPVTIRQMVATPGGVTEAELKELANADVAQSFVDAIRVGTAKSKMISEGLAHKAT